MYSTAVLQAVCTQQRAIRRKYFQILSKVQIIANLRHRLHCLTQREPRLGKETLL
jgi:hypothetical protein